MTSEEIPRKWKFIADKLKEFNAPLKVVNAAIELDNITVSLGLGYNTPYWARHSDEIHTAVDVNDMIFSRRSCTACAEVNNNCDDCRMGEYGHCTPRKKYADDYFGIVGRWSSEHLRYELH